MLFILLSVIKKALKVSIFCLKFLIEAVFL